MPLGFGFDKETKTTIDTFSEQIKSLSPEARILHTRIEQLLLHHQERYADVLAACRQQPGSAFDMLPVLFKRSLDLHQTTFAMGESIAHLHGLLEDGLMHKILGADGVLRFQTAG